MRVEINAGVRAQLLTMPEADQKKVHRAVAQLETAFPNVERLHKVDQYLWSFHVARELRMLVRTVGNALRVIALASPEQIQRYSVRSQR